MGIVYENCLWAFLDCCRCFVSFVIGPYTFLPISEFDNGSVHRRRKRGTWRARAPPPIWENILRAIIIYNSGIVRANISKYDKKMSGILIILGAKIM